MDRRRRIMEEEEVSFNVGQIKEQAVPVAIFSTKTSKPDVQADSSCSKIPNHDRHCNHTTMMNYPELSIPFQKTHIQYLPQYSHTSGFAGTCGFLGTSGFLENIPQ